MASWLVGTRASTIAGVLGASSVSSATNELTLTWHTSQAPKCCCSSSATFLPSLSSFSPSSSGRGRGSSVVTALGGIRKGVRLDGNLDRDRRRTRGCSPLSPSPLPSSSPSLSSLSSSSSWGSLCTRCVVFGDKRLGRTAVGSGVCLLPRGRRDPSVCNLSGKGISCPGGKIGISNHTCMAASGSGEKVENISEKAGWDKRKEEAGEDALASTDSWQWSLDWNEVTPQILVGSCPRSAADVDMIVEKGNVSGILNLQSDLCFAALEIPFDSIRKRALERGIFLARVPIRDFDHADQALMLPEAVRILNTLVSKGLRVYVHCTAGINRATLTVVGYLTFVKGMTLDDAVALVKAKRKVAHPYIDCWQDVKKKLLDGRQEELTALSRKIYESRCEGGHQGSSQSDWQAAQRAAICRIFVRWLEVDMGALDVERELTERRLQSVVDKANALADSAKRLVRGGAKLSASETSNGTGFSYATYVADSEKLIDDEVYEPEEPYDPSSSLECNVITRECSIPETKYDDEWGPDPDLKVVETSVDLTHHHVASSSSTNNGVAVAVADDSLMASSSDPSSMAETSSSSTSTRSPSPSSSSSLSSSSPAVSLSSSSGIASSSWVSSAFASSSSSTVSSSTQPSLDVPQPEEKVSEADTSVSDPSGNT